MGPLIHILMNEPEPPNGLIPIRRPRVGIILIQSPPQRGIPVVRRRVLGHGRRDPRQLEHLILQLRILVFVIHVGRAPVILINIILHGVKDPRRRRRLPLEIVGMGGECLLLVRILCVAVVDEVDDILLEYFVGAIVRESLPKMSKVDGFLRHDNEGGAAGQTDWIAVIVLLAAKTDGDGIFGVVCSANLEELRRVDVVFFVTVLNGIGNYVCGCSLDLFDHKGVLGIFVRGEVDQYTLGKGTVITLWKGCETPLGQGIAA